MPKTNAEVVTDMLVRQYNNKDITAVDDYIADDHIDHNPTPGQEQGKAGVRKLIQNVIDNTDSTVEIHKIISEGDFVCTRYTVTSRNRKDFFGVPADGKVTKAHIIGLDRIANEQLVESWGEYNGIDVMRQLGIELGFEPGHGH
jgi:predicted ester cyclase